VIRITKKIAGARGVFEVGQEVTFEPEYEAGLVGAGAAVYVGTPAAKPVETAEAPSAPETAEAPKPKSRKRRTKKA